MFAKIRAIALVCGIAAIFSFGCKSDNTSADMNGDAKCAKTGEACQSKDGKCCGACKEGEMKKDEAKK